MPEPRQTGNHADRKKLQYTTNNFITRKKSVNKIRNRANAQHFKYLCSTHKPCTRECCGFKHAHTTTTANTRNKKITYPTNTPRIRQSQKYKNQNIYKNCNISPRERKVRWMTHMRPERPEIRSPAENNPSCPNRGHGPKNSKPWSGLQRLRSSGQRKPSALQQRADRCQHFKRGSVQVLDEHPGAGGCGAG